MRVLVLAPVIACALAAGCLKTTVDTETLRRIDTSARFSGPPAIEILPVVDARKDVERIGVSKDGYNFERRDVRATDDVATWLGASIASSLALAGADARRVDAPAAGGAVLRLTLRQLFVEANPGMWTIDVAAKAVLDAELTLPDGRAYRRRFGGFEKETYFQLPRDVYEARIHDAVDELVERVVEGVYAVVVQGRLE